MQCAHGVHDIPGFLGGKPAECPASSPPGYSPSKKSQLPASQRPAPGSRPLATLDLAWLGGQWAMGPFLQGRGEVRYSRLAPASSVRVVSSAPHASAPPCGRRPRHSPSAHRRCRRGPSAPPGLRPLFYTQFHVVGTTSFALEILILKFSKDQNFW